VRCLTEQHWCSDKAQRIFPTRQLAHYQQRAEKNADLTVIDERDYLDCFGFPEPGAARLGDVWQHLIESRLAGDPGYAEWSSSLELILTRGCLARRVLAATGPEPDRDSLEQVYRQLADCLSTGRGFEP
jgi:hypothetical protein